MKIIWRLNNQSMLNSSSIKQFVWKRYSCKEDNIWHLQKNHHDGQQGILIDAKSRKIYFFNPSTIGYVYLDLVKVMALVNLLQDRIKIKS